MKKRGYLFFVFLLVLSLSFAAAEESTGGIFGSKVFTEMILPFLLVFVVLFAILQKTKILGEGKAQIDALVSLSVALIFIGVPTTRDLVVNILPWLVIGAVIILAFMILYGFVAGDLSKTPNWMKIVFGILAGLFVIGVVIYISGLWPKIQGWFSGAGGSDLWTNILLLLVIGVAITVALASGKKSSGRSKED